MTVRQHSRRTRHHAKTQRTQYLFISADQQRGDAIRCAGTVWIITPNLETLAGDGVLFWNTFAYAAACISSRSAFYHALYPHTTGILGFYQSSGQLHWTNRLSAAGYHCVSIGKTHLPQGGFDERIDEMPNQYQPFLDQGRNAW